LARDSAQFEKICLSLYLGIEIGGTKLQLVLGGETARIGHRLRIEVEPAHGAAGIRQQIEHALPKLTTDRSVEAAAVGFGGPVDWNSGTICRSHQIEGWSGFDLRQWLQQLTGAPVLVDNDANVAALGEAKFGAGMGCNPVFYVTLGSGVGGGLVTDGSIYHGASPGEAEIGHIRLDRKGTTIESRCSGWAMDGRIIEAKRRAPHGLLSRLVGDAIGGEARHLAKAVQQGDAAAEAILIQLADDLAFGLSHVVHLLHPQVIILGGGLAGVGEPLRAKVENSLRPHVMKAFRPGPKVALSALGEDAVPVGALVLAQRLSKSGSSSSSCSLHQSFGGG
jgi:glucokinase